MLDGGQSMLMSWNVQRRPSVGRVLFRELSCQMPGKAKSPALIVASALCHASIHFLASPPLTLADSAFSNSSARLIAFSHSVFSDSLCGVFL